MEQPIFWLMVVTLERRTDPIMINAGVEDLVNAFTVGVWGHAWAHNSATATPEPQPNSSIPLYFGCVSLPPGNRLSHAIPLARMQCSVELEQTLLLTSRNRWMLAQLLGTPAETILIILISYGR